MKRIFDPLERFEIQHEKIPISGCWIWTGITKTGADDRPYISVHGKQKSAYRFAYEEFVGPIPAGLWVLHRCDVSLCVNPHHLFVGTNSDNQKDAFSKGRHAFQTHKNKFDECRIEIGKRNGLLKGSRRPNAAKIPYEDYGKIIEKLKTQTQLSVAKEYGVRRTSLQLYLKRNAPEN